MACVRNALQRLVCLTVCPQLVAVCGDVLEFTAAEPCWRKSATASGRGEFVALLATFCFLRVVEVCSASLLLGQSATAFLIFMVYDY